MSISDYYLLEHIWTRGSSQYADISYYDDIEGIEIAFTRISNEGDIAVFGTDTVISGRETVGLFTSSSDYTTYKLYFGSSQEYITLTGLNSFSENIIKIYDGSIYINETYYSSCADYVENINHFYISRGYNPEKRDFCEGNFSYRYIKIWGGNRHLDRNLVPAMRITDNKIGFYDYITEELYVDKGNTPIFGYDKTNPYEAGNINVTYENGTKATYTAISNTGYMFSNWLINGRTNEQSNPIEVFVKGSDNNVLSMNANFIETYKVNIIVNPIDYGTVTGAGYYAQGSQVTLTASPGNHKLFVNWTLNGAEVSTNSTYSFTMGNVAQTYTANFVDAPQYDIITKTDPSDLIMVAQSAKRVYSGETVTLRARSIDGYQFDRWSTGETTTTITITVTSNVTIVASYKKIADITEKYLYRAYIKSKTALNSLPIAYLNIKTFTIREDLLASCNSEFETYSVPTEINNGDILCLYNPKGKVIYKGIITKINEKEINCSQMQSFYKGTWYENNYTTATTIEGEFQYLLDRYANGYIYNSTYQDSLVHDELAPLRVIAGSSTTGNLETFESKKTTDMEKYIYTLYDSYGIVLDFNIPYGSWSIGDQNGGSTTIKVPSESAIKISNNVDCITNMSPTLEIEEDNRLIIFSSNGTYRKTYVATSTSGIVEEPTSQVGRFNVVNTEIVFSDDQLSNIVKSKLPETMYNHKVSFNLLLNNNIYNFWDWRLGQQFQIYKHDEITFKDEYFLSVYTGYEISKKENEEISEVQITCGKVRTALTDKIKLGVVRYD